MSWVPEPNRDPAARRLAHSLARMVRWLRHQALRRERTPEPEIEPALTGPIENWQQTVEQRLKLLEKRHDTTMRRQTLLIMLAIAGEFVLEIIKRNQ